jgi:protein-S-isoprenylcysteine O-methyltransferase Ste14
VLYKAQQNKTLATKGLYAYVRHPQYDAFILVMIGFLIQWSTILTLLMFPVLVWSYFLLAKREEKMFWQTLAKNIPVIWQKPLHSYRI